MLIKQHFSLQNLFRISNNAVKIAAYKKGYQKTKPPSDLGTRKTPV